MITTNIIEAFTKDNRFFSVGSGNETILIQGSCRMVAYANYLNEWNKKHNRFKIYIILPYLFGTKENINSLENNQEFLNLIKDTKIHISEYIGFEKPKFPMLPKPANLGILNYSQQMATNIYQFGMNPDIDIVVPSWDDHFVLWNDILNFNKDLKDRFDLNPEEVNKEIYWITQEHYNKFFQNTSKTDFPEFIDYFYENFRDFRMCWTMNHNTKNFTLPLFRMINDKFLKLDLDGYFWNAISQHDHLQGNCTQLTKYDIEYYNYNWK